MSAELRENAKTFFGWGVFLLTILIVIDQFTKLHALGIYQNYDFAFGLRVNVYLMYLIYFIGVGGIAVYLAKHFKVLFIADLVAWVLILSGAASNVAERVYLGYVRDWIYILNGIFNLADGYIIIGIVILLAQSVKCKT